MAPPSPLAIATSSLLRLVKEEASYHKELQQQESRIRKLEAQDQAVGDEENVEFLLRQEVEPLLLHLVSFSNFFFHFLFFLCFVCLLIYLCVCAEEGARGDESGVSGHEAADSGWVGEVGGIDCGFFSSFSCSWEGRLWYADVVFVFVG